MSTRRIATRLAVEGEAQYKQAIRDANNEIRNFNSELQLVESTYRNNANSIEALTAKKQALENVQSSLENKQKELTKAQTGAIAAQEKYSERVVTAKEKITQIEAELENLKNTQGDTTEQQETLTAELEKWKAELAEAEGHQAAATRAVDEYGRQLNQNEIELHKNADAIDENNKYLAEAEAAADGAATSIDEYGNSTEKATDATEGFAETLVALGIAKLLKDIVDALKAAVDASAQYETALAKIQAQTEMTAAEMGVLRDNIRELGRQGNHSAREIAQAYSEVALRGQDAAHGTEIMRTAMVLADATGERLSSTAYFIGNYLDKIGKDANYAERYLNIFAKTSQGTGIALNTLQDYLFRSNATLQMANISGTEATAVFGELYRQGVRGANAYSGFQQSVQSLLLPSKEASAALDELGINTAELQSRGYSMMEIMFMVGDAMDGVTDNTDRLRISQAIFTQQSALAFSDELFTQRNTLRELIPELHRAGDAATGTGIAYQIAATRADTFDTKMQNARNAAEDLQISIGNALMPALGELASVGATAFTWAAKFIEDNPAVIYGLIGITVAMGALTVAAAIKAGALVKVTAALIAMKLAMATNPILLLASALAGLVVGIGTFILSQERANAETRAFIETLEESRKAHQDNLASINEHTGNINDLLGAFERLSAVEGHNEAQKRALQAITEKLIQLVPELANHVDEYTGALNSSIETIRAVALAEIERDRIQAKVARLSQLYVEQVAVTEELEDAQLALALATETLNHGLTGAELTTANWNGTITRNQRAANEARDAYNMLAAAAYELENEIAELEGTVNIHIEAQNELTAAMEESARASYEASAAFETQAQYVDGLISELEELKAEYDAVREAAYQSITRTLGHFNTLETGVSVSIQNTIDALESQVAFMDNYAANIVKAMELGVNVGIIEKLSDGSAQSAEILQGIVDDGGENIDALNEQFARVEEGKNNFSDIVAEAATNFSDRADEMVDRINAAVDEMNVKAELVGVGAMNIQGLIDGMESRRADVRKTVRSIASEIPAAHRVEMMHGSPSRRMFELAVNDYEGYILGAESQKQNVIDAHKDIITSGYYAVSKIATSALQVPQVPQPIQTSTPPAHGDFNFTQNVYTQETNYATQARENAKQFRQIARELTA